MSWIYYGNRNGNPIYCCNRRAGQVCARNGDHSSDLPVCRGKTGYSWSRGAFDAGKPSWISDWALVQMRSSQSANPTDLNNDGVTDINDFAIFVGRFNKPNN